MRRTFKYRIHANSRTLSVALLWLDLCRNLYNTALQQRISAYKGQNKRILSRYDQQNELPELKKVMPEYQSVGSHVLQNVLNRLDKSYKLFFNGGGFPRFKSKSRYNSFTFPDDMGWKLNGKYLSVTKVGIFKLCLSRPILGKIKTVSIKHSQDNRWYVSFSCDNVPERILPSLDTTIALDVGVKSFCVDSEGNKVENPLYMRQAESILRRRQRILSRRVKGSNRRNKARLLVAKTHERIVNQRNDFLYRVANKYIKDYGIIFIEGLVIKNMVKNHHLSKSIYDSSWGKFFELLKYKAEEAGRQVIKVNPSNTSQVCSQCGEKVEKTLAVRIHDCPYCGLVMDRDENAARNINRLGRSLQSLTKEVALCVG